MTTTTFTLSTTRILATFPDALPFASADPMRPVLNAVKVTAAGGRMQLVGCDSYVLGTFTFDVDPALELDCLLELDDVKRIIALAKAEAKVKRGTPVDLTFELDDADTLVVTGSTGSTTCRTVRGEYPRWRALFDLKAPIDGTTTLTAWALSRLAKVTLGHKPDTKNAHSGPGLRIELRGPLKAGWYAMNHDGVAFVGIAMPTRTAATSAIEVPELVGKADPAPAPIETDDEDAS